ncbi:MAG TPA: kelch repeat-containing protein [Mucilaginibacter sp.]|nr:kelch repeat-containing protein [Mucilaginibacter sp.]
MKKLTGVLILSLLMITASAQRPGRWELVQSRNQIAARGECSLVAANNKLYLIGGDGGAKPVEVYDPKTNLWTAKAIAPFNMHHFQAVALGDRIYVLDAFYTGAYPDQLSLPNVYCYDTKNDVWQKLAEIPEDRRRGGAGEAVYDGKLYLVCGITHGHRSGTNAMFDCYDPETNKWTKLPDAPHIRDHSMAVVVGDKLYAIGGRNTSLHDADNFMSFFDKVVLDVDCYDFKTGRWSTLAARLPMGTGGGTAVNLDGVIYYIGGERATSTKPNGPQKDVYRLDPSAADAAWQKVADLNRARNGVGGTVLGHKIYIAGGAGGGPAGPPPTGKQPGSPPPGPPPGNNTENHAGIALEVFTP